MALISLSSLFKTKHCRRHSSPSAGPCWDIRSCSPLLLQVRAADPRTRACSLRRSWSCHLEAHPYAPGDDRDYAWTTMSALEHSGRISRLLHREAQPYVQKDYKAGEYATSSTLQGRSRSSRRFRFAAPSYDCEEYQVHAWVNSATLE
jgi:hypothetical protein